MKLLQLVKGLNQSTIEADRDIAALTDDTRLATQGGVVVWDSRISPALTQKVMADARARGALLISDAEGADVRVSDAGLVLARYAHATWPKQPHVMLGITGTSGKTSVAWFVQQLLAGAGFNAASIGTLGTVRNSKVVDYSGYTSPSALKLHPMLQGLAEDNVSHAVMEVSSHALALGRVDGVQFVAAGITNITQDHFDFHGDYPHYFAAKARLFSEVVPDGAGAVINANRPELMPLMALCKGRGLKLLTVGTSNAELVVEVVEATGHGLHVRLKHDAVPVDVHVPLVGSFQAENVAVALGLCVAGGVAWPALAKAAAGLTGVAGRMELITQQGRPAVVVDYAHKPDALQRVLEALRPMAHAQGGKLWVVFGCGGNRDATKRPLMGAIAAKLADHVIVTDDNPRHENPATIRAAIMAAAGPHAREIGDRRDAIATSIAEAAPNDVVLVAGKGHEDGQIVGDTVLPFDDREVVREMLG